MRKHFGATNPLRNTDSSGRTSYAQFHIGRALVMLAEVGETPQWRNLSPDQIGGTPVMIHIYVPDVDSVARNAVAAGAKLERPIKDEDRGDRVCDHRALLSNDSQAARCRDASSHRR